MIGVGHEMRQRLATDDRSSCFVCLTRWPNPFLVRQTLLDETSAIKTKIERLGFGR